jgi:hypothetical protein
VLHDDTINVTYVITAIDRATRTVTQSQRSVHREAEKVNRSFADQATQQERVGVEATRSSRSVVAGEVDKRREVQRTTREVHKQTAEWDTLRNHSISDNDAMTRAFAKFRYELAAGGGGIRNISRNVRNMGDSFDRSGNKVVRANRNFMFLGNTIKILKWPALIAGAGGAPPDLLVAGRGHRRAGYEPRQRLGRASVLRRRARARERCAGRVPGGHHGRRPGTRRGEAGLR